MDPLSLCLYFFLGALMIDGVLELAFIVNMVSWLHTRAGGIFLVDGSNQLTFGLHGKPLHLMVDQGHTSNGAAGTAIILVGFGGILALSLRHLTAARSRSGGLGRLAVICHRIWLVITVLSVLLTLSALIYTFVVTHQTSGQTIDLAVASQLEYAPSQRFSNYPDSAPYPLDKWTPETWFEAVLELPLAHSHDINDIRSQLRLMAGWRWNLIPLLVLGVAVCALALSDASKSRVRAREGKNFHEDKVLGVP